MSNLKHVGRLAKSKRRIVVAFRTVPDEPDNCIVVTTENLSADEHDTLIQAVESSAGQEANDFSQVMSRTILPDGRNMLAHFHTTGKMVKVATNEVEMVPNRNTTIMLNELNEVIANQMGVTVEELSGASVTDSSEQTEVEQPVEESVETDGVLSDEDLAARYRSDADRLFKEAKRLREEAEKLAPTKKKSKAAESV